MRERSFLKIISERLVFYQNKICKANCYQIRTFLNHISAQQTLVIKSQFHLQTSRLGILSQMMNFIALLSVMENLKHRAILTITYTAGLRISETAHLKVSDIDGKRMMVRVEQGKGGKDRYTILSRTALECLRQYWRAYRPTEWLFEGQIHVSRINLAQVTSPLDSIPEEL